MQREISAIWGREVLRAQRELSRSGPERPGCSRYRAGETGWPPSDTVDCSPCWYSESARQAESCSRRTALCRDTRDQRYMEPLALRQSDRVPVKLREPPGVVDGGGGGVRGQWIAAGGGAQSLQHSIVTRHILLRIAYHA